LQEAEGKDDVEPEDAREELLVRVEVLDVRVQRVHQEVEARVGLSLAKPWVIVRHHVDEEVQRVGHCHEKLCEESNYNVGLFPEAGLVLMQDDHRCKHSNEAKERGLCGHKEEDHTE
jgi:hypothetical protein